MNDKKEAVKPEEKPIINPQAMRQMLKLEEEKRIQECQAKIAEVLKEYDCRLEPRMMAMNNGMRLDVLMVVNTNG